LLVAIHININYLTLTLELGTPLQNNIEELFNLMNFLGLEDFEDPKEMAEAYGDLNKEQLEQLHVKLKPYFLRRTREQVLHFLPPKVVISYKEHAVIQYVSKTITF
jgi:SNF2 family DNA or RNA helicase